jgi:KaiC/GvpD/RAD55 family RecA-like ATPase
MEWDYDFNVITWKQVEEREFPVDQWRVFGLVPINGLTFIAGVSGEKKTWFAMHMAYCIATGSHVFGSEKFTVREGRVLYIDAEMGIREFKRRGGLLRFGQIPEGKLLLMSEQSVDIRDDFVFDKFTEFIEENQVDVLIIDTLRGVAGGLNEDKAEEVRAFLQRFNTLKNRGVTVIVLDHCRKPIRNEGYSPKKEQLLGSQDKVANAESVVMLKSETGAEGFAVYQVKSRNGIEIKPFMALMTDKVEEGCIEFTYSGEYDEQVSKMDSARLVLPQVIGTGSYTTKQLVEIMRNDHKVGERYVKEALRDLAQRETLVIEKLGKENSYKNKSTALLLQESDGLI